MTDFRQSGNNCEYGHVFVWCSNQTVDIVAPKGTLCKCGMYKADGNGGMVEAKIYERKGKP